LRLEKDKNVCVLGLGYIGLPTAATLANAGIKVLGVDINPTVVEKINSGTAHIYEKGLDELLAKSVSSGLLTADTRPAKSDTYVIAVPTPFIEKEKRPDLSFVVAAINSISPILKNGDLIIIESTINVGATEFVRDCLSNNRTDLKFPYTENDDPDIYIAHCPERVLPGKILHEIINNDRIIGGISNKCANEAVQFYKQFVKGDCTTASSSKLAELCKLVENSFRDVNIAFANEISLISDKLDINVWELLSLVNRHPRVNVLNPGPGVGGHCIAVDPWFLVDADPLNAKLTLTARQINDEKPKWVINKFIDQRNNFKVEKLINKNEKISVAIYGLTFKPNIDDLRESPALIIAESISNIHEGPIDIIEPNLEILPVKLQRKNIKKVTYSNADIHIMLVFHDEFAGFKKPIGYVVDTIGVWK
jgi:UDP-N-acetyl-D-mannosaminuronic acid dehydrogenase